LTPVSRLKRSADRCVIEPAPEDANESWPARGVAVGRRLGRDGHADGTRGAGAIVGDHLLAERFRKDRSQTAGDDVGDAARRPGYDETYRPRRIFLRGRLRRRTKEHRAEQQGCSLERAHRILLICFMKLTLYALT
jgi:hypothetical protein